MRRTLATMALLTVVLVACGGDSDDAQPSTPTTAAVPGSVDTDFSGKDGEKFCSLVRSNLPRLDQLGTTDPAKLKALVEEAETVFKDAAAAAPSEIKADVQVTAAAYSAFIRQLGQVNYDITKLSPDSLSGLQRPEVQASAQRLSAYTEKVCGITAPSVP